MAREEEKVKELADDFQTQVVGTLSRANLWQKQKKKKNGYGMFPDSEMAEEYRKLAEAIYAVVKMRKDQPVKKPMLKRVGLPEIKDLRREPSNKRKPENQPDWNSIPRHMETGILYIQECFCRKPDRSMSVQITVCGCCADSSGDECGRQIFLCDRGRRGSV